MAVEWKCLIWCIKQTLRFSRIVVPYYTPLLIALPLGTIKMKIILTIILTFSFTWTFSQTEKEAQELCEKFIINGKEMIARWCPSEIHHSESQLASPVESLMKFLTPVKIDLISGIPDGILLLPTEKFLFKNKRNSSRGTWTGCMREWVADCENTWMIVSAKKWSQ